tara:strand:- start:1762 stop:3486 length:1725 start_codon:yes stop_codon:yes gene_type:complete
MRQSKLLAPTVKEIPADTEIISHQLMIRAGLIRQLASGLYTWLPMGLRVIRKIESIVRQELELVGAQELLMPIVQPAELWEETGRWEKMGPELLRLSDRHDRDFCLGPTHEEVITDLFRREVQSYKQMPCNFFQIQTKFRDEVRPRFGVMRAREFTMKDGYSFHLDDGCLETTYQKMYQCYENILTRMNLTFRAVEADTGNIGGSASHEFHVLAENGEDIIAYATEGDYAANLEKAVAGDPPPRPEPKKRMEKIETPGKKSINQVAQFLDVSPANVLKTILAKDNDKKIIGLVLRGDHQLNEIKTLKLLNRESTLELASEEEIVESIGCSPGSLGPHELPIPFFVDQQAAACANFICGANQDGLHLVNANWIRDITLNDNQIVDIRNVSPGDLAPGNQGTLELARGIEVGHIFQLGKKYSHDLKATVLDNEGNSVTPLMGCYGMGITRLVAAVIEQHHNSDGITWPEPLAPFQLQILSLNYQKSSAVKEFSDRLYQDFTALEIEVLFDDRDARPGVKFAEADLLGIPHRLVLGDRGLKEGNIEYRHRTIGGINTELVKLEDVVEYVKELLNNST